MSSTILVTGVSRHLGAAVARRLIELPDVRRVIGLDVIHPSEALEGVEFVRADIRNAVVGRMLEHARRLSEESEAAAAICEALSTFDYLYLSGISLAILSPTSREKLLSLLRECRANGGKVIFDNNYRPRLWSSREETQQVYQQMLQSTDIAFLTLDDEDALWGEKPVEDVIARTQAAGVSEVVIKRGAESCLVAITGEAAIEVPAVKLAKEKVIDTTAAGDSFSAGYLAVRLTGGTPEAAAQRGHLTASTVIQYRGAIIPREAMPV